MKKLFFSLMATAMISTVAFANTNGNDTNVETKKVKKEISTTPSITYKEERIQKGARILCRLTLFVTSGNKTTELMFTNWADTRSECSAFFNGVIRGYSYGANVDL